MVAAEAAIARADPPAHVGQRLPGRSRHAMFEPQGAGRAEVRTVLAHRLGGTFMMPARRVPRRLDLEAIINAVDDDLRLALRLHVAAHHPERHPGRTVPGCEARNDRLE